MKIQTINPATGKVIQDYATMSADETSSIIDSVHQTYEAWKSTSFAERAEKMRNLTKVLLDNKEEYAKLMTLEMGKPIFAAVAEIEKCAVLSEYYAENAEHILKNRLV